MKNILKYLISRVFWRNFSIAIGVAVFLLVFVFTFIRIYSSHGRAYAVPDYTDMQMDRAFQNAEKKHFRHEVSDSLYVSTKEPGVILDQHPKPGVLVKKNRKIYFTINASGPEKMAMPNFVGITLREVKARIVSSGLLVGKLSYRYDISKNIVLEQRVNGVVIEFGDSITKGTSIDLVLGKGLGNEKALVPNLLGLTIEEAKEKVSNAMFNIGAVVPDGTVDEKNDTIPARIFRQRPSSSEKNLISLGATVTVWTTMDSTKLPGYNKAGEQEELIWPELDEENEKDTSNTHDSSL